MTRPKIKDKLPEKLPPVEPDEKKEMEVTGEKVGAPIEENFVSVDELKAETFPEEDPKPKHGVSHDFCIEEMEANAKEAQPDKYPSHAGKAEQPFLFGEADQILNALETELTYWNGVFEKLDEAYDRTRLKMDTVKLRIDSLHSAIAATRKHAPMKEDPAPPKKEDEAAIVKEEATSLTDAVEKTKTTTPSTDPAPEAPTSSAPAAKGAAERNKATEDLLVKFRNPTQPLPDLLFPGDILVTSWETGPYRVEQISGPFHAATVGDEEVPSPDHYSIQCSDVDAKRNKDGRLPKNYEYSYLNMVIAVGNRFLSVYADSSDEIFLKASGPPYGQQEKAPETKQADLPSTDQSTKEEIY